MKIDLHIFYKRILRKSQGSMSKVTFFAAEKSILRRYNIQNFKGWSSNSCIQDKQGTFSTYKPVHFGKSYENFEKISGSFPRIVKKMEVQTKRWFSYIKRRLFTILSLRGEWPSGPASFISFTEVKHGCVRSETGWATFQMNDQKTAHSAVLRKGL